MRVNGDVCVCLCGGATEKGSLSMFHFKLAHVSFEWRGWGRLLLVQDTVAFMCGEEGTVEY